MEKVTLYIPCYNAEDTIDACLTSVFEQSYPIDEVLVIDDGSADRTLERVQRFSVRIISHGVNRGIAAARNRAFQEAHNEHLAALDADCVAHPQWLAHLMACMTKHGVSGAGGTLREQRASTIVDTWRTVRLAQQWGEQMIMNPPYLYGSNTVLKKSDLKAIGLYREVFVSNYEDVDVSERLYARGCRLCYEPAARVEHLRNGGLMSALRQRVAWHRGWQRRMGEGQGRLRKGAYHFGSAMKYARPSQLALSDTVRKERMALLLVDSIYSVYLFFSELSACARTLSRTGEI